MPDTTQSTERPVINVRREATDTPTVNLHNPNAELKISVEMIQEWLGLPPDMRVVGVREQGRLNFDFRREVLVLVLQCDGMPPVPAGQPRHELDIVYQRIRGIGGGEVTVVKEINVMVTADNVEETCGALDPSGTFVCMRPRDHAELHPWDVRAESAARGEVISREATANAAEFVRPSYHAEPVSSVDRG